MTAKVSLSAKNSENWLLSYTDLFLLVLSFFVLRFSILKYDIHPRGEHQEELSAAPESIEEDPRIYFKIHPLEKGNSALTSQTSIGPDWFSESGLSSRGEREMHYLGKQIEGSRKKATIRLPIAQGLETLEKNKQISLVIQNLKELGLTSVKVEMTIKEATPCKGSTDGHPLACFSLDF